MIAGATIGLCFLTEQGAKLLGIALPEQANVALVKTWMLHAFDSWRNFGVFAFLVAQVALLLPALEELVFRGLLFRLPLRWCGVSPCIGEAGRLPCVFAVVSSALFSAAHYLKQPWPDNAFLALFFFGLAQCWLYRRTGRIWCAMANHALFNLTNLVLLVFID